MATTTEIRLNDPENGVLYWQQYNQWGELKEKHIMKLNSVEYDKKLIFPVPITIPEGFNIYANSKEDILYIIEKPIQKNQKKESLLKSIFKLIKTRRKKWRKEKRGNN